MVSHNSFRLLGYFYAGLCLCSSILLLINACLLINVNSHEVITVGAWMLIFSFISILFNTSLITGIIMRRTKYVIHHLKFVSFIYALVLLGLFVGCIIMGVLISSEVRNLLVGAAFIAGTGVFILGIILTSIFYTLTFWILKGVMDFINYEIMRCASSEEGIIY